MHAVTMPLHLHMFGWGGDNYGDLCLPAQNNCNPEGFWVTPEYLFLLRTYEADAGAAAAIGAGEAGLPRQTAYLRLGQVPDRECHACSPVSIASQVPKPPHSGAVPFLKKGAPQENCHCPRNLQATA